MTRLYLWAGSIAAVLALLAGVWLHGRSAGTSASDAARNREIIETRSRMDAADPDFNRCGWSDWLRDACQ